MVGEAEGGCGGDLRADTARRKLAGMAGRFTRSAALGCHHQLPSPQVGDASWISELARCPALAPEREQELQVGVERDDAVVEAIRDVQLPVGERHPVRAVEERGALFAQAEVAHCARRRHGRLSSPRAYEPRGWTDASSPVAISAPSVRRSFCTRFLA